MDNLVLVEKTDGVATVTMNRPEHLNALSSGLRAAIARTFTALKGDEDIGVVILTGAGRAFTAGLDLKELGGERAADISRDEVRAAGDLSDAIAAVGKPVIGAINGYAITGGFEIALMCDFLIASTKAAFADTHARVGVVPGWGLSQRLPRLIGINRAKELSLTGNFLSAELACEWGLVNRVVEPADLLPVCRQLAADILTTDPATRGEIRRIMDEGWHTTLDAGLTVELEANAAHDKRQTPREKVAERRAAIQARGRQSAL